MVKVYTLVLIVKDDKILLGMKKRGFGAGWWNGFGGKVQPGESILEAAQREVKEESGLKVENLHPRGVLSFTFEGEEDIHEANIFETRTFTGEPVETEEMLPQWFEFSDMPYDKMWPADRIWIPEYIKGKILKGTFNFTKDKQVASYTLDS
jgi:8-oxo-dGTP diphosphatase/2-hydroxy-dATP diphosphatase